MGEACSVAQVGPHTSDCPVTAFSSSQPQRRGGNFALKSTHVGGFLPGNNSVQVLF